MLCMAGYPPTNRRVVEAEAHAYLPVAPLALTIELHYTLLE
jgi:hypothetical protein